MFLYVVSFPLKKTQNKTKTQITQTKTQQQLYSFNLKKHTDCKEQNV